MLQGTRPTRAEDAIFTVSRHIRRSGLASISQDERPNGGYLGSLHTWIDGECSAPGDRPPKLATWTPGYIDSGDGGFAIAYGRPAHGDNTNCQLKLIVFKERLAGVC